MRSNQVVLFVIPALIWGSTWYAIKFQLGVVDPVVSVVYRFLLAAVILLGYCILTKKKMRFGKREHFQFFLQGILLFGFNYWLVYEAELYLTSAMVAIGFSTLIFLNIFFAAIILGQEIRKMVFVGAFLGVSGTALIFWNELRAFNFSDEVILGLILLGASVLSASLGNITSSFNQSRKSLPVLQSNAYGMAYGALTMALCALILGHDFNFDSSGSYMISLAYLAVFGSIIAFGSYLTLIGQIGADRAAYVILVIPVIALLISWAFEGYQITSNAVYGTVLILSGNLLAIRKRSFKR